jgi:hypothetical protein
MSINDLILFAVIFGSAAVAIFLPDAGRVFHPYLLYFLMLLLFLSFLKIDINALLDPSRLIADRLGRAASQKTMKV